MVRMVAACSLSLWLSLGVTAPANSATEAGAGEAVEPAPEAAPMTLDELLQKVREGWRADAARLREREQGFVQSRDTQAAALGALRADKARLEGRAADLERDFESNEKEIAQLEETLRQRLGAMGELFGVIRQVAGDTAGQLEASLISSQLAERSGPLSALAQSKELPTVEQLQGLWFALQQEMVESGKVTRYRTTVVAPNGAERQAVVTRVGPFNAVSEGRYLRWLPEVKKLAELPRQPSARYLATVGPLEAAKGGLVRVAVDPSRGSILSLLVQTPTLAERIELGGAVGYLILVLGVFALLVALWRLVTLAVVSARVRRQQGETKGRSDNPLGRVIIAYEGATDLPPEALELKLDEAIVREQTRLGRFAWVVKVVSVVAPLLGLLGTVTGMIRTFQAITLFGAGDPKLMAGGISEALVTTMLGLIVAIPLVLLHSWLTSLTRSVMEVLGEQATGIIAHVAEENSRHESAA